MIGMISHSVVPPPSLAVPLRTKRPLLPNRAQERSLHPDHALQHGSSELLVSRQSLIGRSFNI